MAAKKFFGQEVGMADPSDEPVEVTSNDETPLEGGQCNYLYVGTGGDLVVKVDEDSDPVTYKNVPDGAYVWVRALYVMEASTAEDIIAHY